MRYVGSEKCGYLDHLGVEEMRERNVEQRECGRMERENALQEGECAARGRTLYRISQHIT